VRQAWPEIRKLCAAGHSLKDIWTWVNEIGIEIGYARLSHYIGQLRRKEAAEMQILSAIRAVPSFSNGAPSLTNVEERTD